MTSGNTCNDAVTVLLEDVRSAQSYSALHHTGSQQVVGSHDK